MPEYKPGRTVDAGRRECLKRVGALALAGLAPAGAGRALAAVAAGGSIGTRIIPSSGEALPMIGLGTARTFNVGNSERELEPLAEVLRRFADAGGSLVDSSPMYGRSEAVVGRLSSELGINDKLFMATKVWTTGRTSGIAQMRESAELLQDPTIELMQIHNLVDWQTHLATLREWKQEGRIRYIGITHYHAGALERLAAIIRSEPVDFLQINYSLAEPEAERELLPLARDRGVAVLANRPFAKGAMFRRVRGRDLPGWAAEIDCRSWAQLFLKYLLGNPAVTCPIPATRKPRHLADNMGAGRGVMPDAAQLNRIRRLWAAL